VLVGCYLVALRRARRRHATRPVAGSEPLRWRLSPLARYLLILAAMPADILTGAVLMLHGRIGDFGTGDVHASGLIMVAGSELIMAALAVALAVAFTGACTR
jgi:preprotein translocase subunit SecG